MAGGGMVKALNANEMTTTPETTSTVQPPMSGGKGAGRVSPTVESRPMFRPAPGKSLSRPITPPPSTGGGGKGAGRVVNPSSIIPTTPLVSKEQFVNRIGPEPIPRGLDNPVFRSLGQQRMEDRQDMAYNRFINTTSAGGQEQFLSNPPINPANPPMINNLTTGTSITQEEFQNRMRPPQTGGLGAKAIFKQGGLIGLMRRR